MRRHPWRNSGRLFQRRAVAAVLSVLPATALHAAPLAPSAGYMDRTRRSCSAVLDCSIAFARVPTGKVLLVTNVSCWMTSSSLDLKGILFGIAPRTIPLDLVYQGGSVGIQSVVAAEQIHHVFAAGRAPTITASTFATANITIDCTIAGELKDE